MRRKKVIRKGRGKKEESTGKKAIKKGERKKLIPVSFKEKKKFSVFSEMGIHNIYKVV